MPYFLCLLKEVKERQKLKATVHELATSYQKDVRQHSVCYNCYDLDDMKRLTLASPASDQHVALLALTVVGAHAVDAAAPLTV